MYMTYLVQFMHCTIDTVYIYNVHCTVTELNTIIVSSKKFFLQQTSLHNSHRLQNTFKIPKKNKRFHNAMCFRSGKFADS